MFLVKQMVQPLLLLGFQPEQIALLQQELQLRQVVLQLQLLLLLQLQVQRQVPLQVWLLRELHPLILLRHWRQLQRLLNYPELCYLLKLHLLLRKVQIVQEPAAERLVLLMSQSLLPLLQYLRYYPEPYYRFHWVDLVQVVVFYQLQRHPEM